MADWNLVIGLGIGAALPAVAVVLWTLLGMFLRATAKASAWSWHKIGSDSGQAVRAKSASVVYAGKRVRAFSAGDLAVVVIAGQDQDDRRQAEAALRRPIKRKAITDDEY